MKSPMVLVVDDEPDFRESICDLLRDSGYDVESAGSAPQALEIASRQKPSIALLDLSMPGVDGLQLLRYFRSRHVFRMMPVILLSGGVRKDAVHAALQLGVKDVMLKSKFTLKELVERIELRLNGPVEVVRSPELAETPGGRDSQAVPITVVRQPSSVGGSSSVFAPSSESDFDSGSSGFDAEPSPMRPDSEAVRPSGMRTSTPTPDMIDAIGKLRALPRSVAQLLRLSAEPDTSLSDLEFVVRGDPVLTARIIQAANSAAFVRGAPPTQLDEAMRTLGVTNIAKIVSAGAIVSEEDLDGQVGHDLLSVWRHCLAAGNYAERLASGPDRATAFLGGLLHDLPSLFALQYLGSDWLPWRSHAQIKGLPLHYALSEALGCPLESLSGQILSSYRIPAEVAVAIQDYHEFFLAQRPREPGRAARRIDLAHQFAVAAGRPGTEFACVRCVHPDEIKPNQAVDILRFSDNRGLVLREEESGLGEPEDEIPPISVPVVLWRDPRWAVPDPVESALSQVSDCLRVDRLDEINVPGRKRLAVAEPGTLEWARLGAVAPVLVLHRGPLPEQGLEPGVEAIRMPVPLSLLANRLKRRN